MTTLQDEPRRQKRNSRLGLIAFSLLCFFALGLVLLRGTATSEILASDPQTSITAPCRSGCCPGCSACSLCLASGPGAGRPWCRHSSSRY